MSVCTTVVSTRSFWPSSSPEFDGRLHHYIIDRPERLGREPSEPAVECIVSRHRLAIEVGELAQSVSIGDPLTQFAIVQVLDAHQN